MSSNPHLAAASTVPVPCDGSRRSRAKSSIKDWEREFARLHGRRPTKADVLADGAALELFKEYGKLRHGTQAAAKSADNDDGDARQVFRRRQMMRQQGLVDSVKLVDDNGGQEHQPLSTLQLTLSNLGLSARKPTATEGAVAVAVAEAGAKAPASASASTTSDKGPALPPRQQSKAFHPKITRVHIGEDSAAAADNNKNSATSRSCEDNRARLAYDSDENVAADTNNAAAADSKTSSLDAVLEKEAEASASASAAAAALPLAHSTPTSATGMTLYSYIEDGTALRARVTRYRGRMATRPMTAHYVLRNQADNAVLGVARREMSFKLCVVYYVFANVNPSSITVTDDQDDQDDAKVVARLGHLLDAPREAAQWRVKANYDGSLFRVKDAATRVRCGLIYFAPSCVPRSMRLAYRSVGEGSFSFTELDEAALGSGLLRASKARSSCPSDEEWDDNDDDDIAAAAPRPLKMKTKRDTMLPPAAAASRRPPLIVMRNKLPRYSATLKTYCLNFHGRVTMPSVKNFQLVDERPGTDPTDADAVQIQFGRIGNNVFNLDVANNSQVPIFMAFAACLSTFDAVEKL